MPAREVPPSHLANANAASQAALATLTPAEAIELYFELDAPAERDALLRHLAGRSAAGLDGDTGRFLRAAMQQDADPFIRLSAAHALARAGEADGRESVREALAIATDDDLLAEAIAAWLDVEGAGGKAELEAIFIDADRALRERLLAQAALVRLDAPAAAALFVRVLNESEPAALDADLTFGMVPAWLTSAESTKAGQAALARHVAAAKQRLAGAQARRAASPSEAAEDAEDEALERLALLEESLALLALPSEPAGP